MIRELKISLIKVIVLSITLVLVFNIWENLINANSQYINKEIKKENKEVFKKLNSSNLWTTWVAITTNLWIRYKQTKELPVSIYKEVMSIEEIFWNEKNANNELIWKNMLIIKEYKNVLKTNIKSMINSSLNKKDLIDAFIEQLEFRYINWTKNAKNLIKQRNIFISTMEKSNNNIEILKWKINSDFKAYNSSWSLEKINTYLKLKKEYYYAKTYIVYINQFLKEYSILNNYNKKLLDVLINNKEAIIKNAYVVIPDKWWLESLKSFNLIYEESEIKGK